MRNKDGKLGRFADVVSDAGFKAVFCDRENKDVVRDLLNVFMPPGREVASFRLMRTELPGKTDKNKTIRIDLRCVTVEGTEIIIEMQNYSQQYFFRRCLYYASKVYESKLKAGKKKKQGEYVEYNVPPVYMVALLNVPNKHLIEPEDEEKYVFEYAFREKDTLEVPDETISIIFVELNRFAKPLSGCVNAVDKWCYALKHIGDLENKPDELADEEFDRLFRAAEIAHFNEQKRRDYEEDIMRERDYWAQLKYATDTGVEQGRVEGQEIEKRRFALNLKSMVMTFDFILQATGLTEEELKKILS